MLIDASNLSLQQTLIANYNDVEPVRVPSLLPVPPVPKEVLESL